MIRVFPIICKIWHRQNDFLRLLYDCLPMYLLKRVQHLESTASFWCFLFSILLIKGSSLTGQCLNLPATLWHTKYTLHILMQIRIFMNLTAVEVRLCEAIWWQVCSYNRVVHIIAVHLFLPVTYDLTFS